MGNASNQKKKRRQGVGVSRADLETQRFLEQLARAAQDFKDTFEAGIPVRSSGGIQDVGQDPGETVMTLGRARPHDDHPVHDLDTRTLLFGPGVVLCCRDRRVHPARG